ncbi:hypothetical protein [Glaciimonas soli]|uniref:Zinc-ribbon domain-containing protein n=1 Tax=Glaciimonas soli TaxID=2590999 RepID=A0A843YWM8_9BURK|nr:hypothetical protein [Glaciimonas soli]MQR02103.1 hypothetical protein [Glaciimonas soli]
MSRRITIDDMQQLAKERGGLCLSETYLGERTALQWQCAEQHQWMARPNNIMQGGWCSICVRAKTRLDPRLVIEEMQQIAAERGGLCLSATYENDSTRLQWQCANQHQWVATRRHIKRGGWCSFCTLEAKRQTLGFLGKLQQIAIERDGLLLSKTYEGTHQHHQWQCAQQHQWLATPANIKSGKWCPHCAVGQRVRTHQATKGYTLKAMQALAAQHGGVCLSTSYITNDSVEKLHWRCAQGHTWHASGTSIKSGSWCGQCHLASIRNSIETMHTLAQKLGGKCLSTTYRGKKEKLQWQCGVGHTWHCSPKMVKETWCPLCTAHSRSEQGLKEMRQLALQHDVVCLSATYVNSRTKLHWQCKEGHRWEAAPDPLTRVKHWCPQCRSDRAIQNRILATQDAQKLAIKRGGRCLSDGSENINENLTWQCAVGHIWQTSRATIKKGHWCQRCYHLSQAIQRDRTRKDNATKKKVRFSMPNLL